MDTARQTLEQRIAELNGLLERQGLPEIAAVAPSDCLPQKVNARYFTPEKFEQLVRNVRESGHLESAPLVCRAEDAPGKYYIISGHHRVEAARAAGLETILVFVAKPKSRDEIVAKQLSHNELSGQDDKTVLAELFQSITDLKWKLHTGLNDDVAKIDFQSLAFRPGGYKEFTVVFLPEDTGLYDEAIEAVSAELLVRDDAAVRLTSMEYYKKFEASIRRIKKAENIRSNGAALMRLVELANQQMQQNAEAYAKSE